MSCRKLNIGILMLNSPNIGKYAHMASTINKIYADKHGYNFIIHRCPLKKDLNKDWKWDDKDEYKLVWSKPTIIKQYLPCFDYLLFIDSDAVLIDHEKTIENVIEEHFDKKTCFIWAENCQDAHYCWNKSYGNTGVMLFKNSKTTMQILNTWITSANNTCKEWKYKHPREQQCLNILLYEKGKFKENVKLVSHDILNGRDGKWIRHFVGMSDVSRDREIKKILRHKPLF